jgi:hypothetical protein
MGCATCGHRREYHQARQEHSRDLGRGWRDAACAHHRHREAVGRRCRDSLVTGVTEEHLPPGRSNSCLQPERAQPEIGIGCGRRFLRVGDGGSIASGLLTGSVIRIGRLLVFWSTLSCWFEPMLGSWYSGGPPIGAQILLTVWRVTRDE